MQLFWKTVWQFLLKLNIYIKYILTIQLNDSTPEFYPERKENICSFKSTHMKVYSSSIYNHQKQPKCSSLKLFYILSVVVLTEIYTCVKTCRMTNKVNNDAVNWIGDGWGKSKFQEYGSQESFFRHVKFEKTIWH